MKIIDKVEIKYFRSFLDKKIEIQNINDLNIFSGKNDCGKSNILRALNLFFNFETDLGKSINFNEDFSKFRKIEIKNDKVQRKKGSEKEIREQRSFISIKVHFNLINSSSKYSLPDKFWISRTWKPTSEYNKPDEKDNIIVEYKKKNRKNLKKGYEGRLSQSKTIFLSKIKYEYIPAIKDKNFQSYLLSKLQETILSASNTDIVNASKKLEIQLAKAAGKLYAEFEKETSIKSNLKIPESLIDFFKAFEIYTQLNSDGEDSPLQNRGDGIQARFIPTVLEYISENTKYSFTIWGFEEPENSYEYSMASELAKKFLKDYSKKNQIFITTHSFVFLSLEGENITKYRVFNSKSEIVSTNVVEYTGSMVKDHSDDNLLKELGVLEIFTDINKIMEEKLLTYERQIEDLSRNTEPLVYTEGPSDVIYLKYAWNQIYSEIIPFEIKSSGHSNQDGSVTGGYNQLRANLDVPNNSNRIIIGLFDNDEGFNAYNGLKPSIFTLQNIFSKSNVLKNVVAVIIPEIEYRNNYHLIHKLPIEALFEDNTLKKYNVTILENKMSIKDVNNNIVQIDYKSFADFKKVKLAEKISNGHQLTSVEIKSYKRLFEEIKKYIK